MGILDVFRSGGRALGRAPGKFVHAMSQWEPVVDQNRTQIPAMQTGPVQIGEDPQTGEPIYMDPAEVGGFEAANPGNQVVGERKVGQSRLGKFMTNVLPKLAQGAIAGGATPGSGSGAVDFFRAMDAGQSRVQQQDALAYNRARQMRQDQVNENERLARAEEYRANAERLSRPVHQKAAEPNNYAQFLLRKLNEAKTPEEEKAITDEIKAQNRFIRDGSGHIWDSQEQKFVENPAEAPKESVTDAKQRTAWSDRENRKGIAEERGWLPDSPEYISFVDFNKPYVPPKGPVTRRGPAVAAVVMKRQDEDLASGFLADAGQDPDKAITLAKSKNARVSVLNILVDHKKKTAPPPPRPSGGRTGGSITDGLTGGSNKLWEYYRKGAK